MGRGRGARTESEGWGKRTELGGGEGGGTDRVKGGGGTDRRRDGGTGGWRREGKSLHRQYDKFSDSFSWLQSTDLVKILFSCTGDLMFVKKFYRCFVQLLFWKCLTF